MSIKIKFVNMGHVRLCVLTGIMAIGKREAFKAIYQTYFEMSIFLGYSKPSAIIIYSKF